MLRRPELDVVPCTAGELGNSGAAAGVSESMQCAVRTAGARGASGPDVPSVLDNLGSPARG